jgi:hypothetical protein
MLQAFVGHYSNGKKQWEMTTMTMKQQQQWEEDVKDEGRPQRGWCNVDASKASRYDMTFSCFIVLLLVKLNITLYYLFYITSLWMLSALSASAVTR